MTRRLRKKRLLQGCVGLSPMSFMQWANLRWWADTHPKWDTTDRRVNHLLQKLYKSRTGRRRMFHEAGPTPFDDEETRSS